MSSEHYYIEGAIYQDDDGAFYLICGASQKVKLNSFQADQIYPFSFKELTGYDADAFLKHYDPMEYELNQYNEAPAGDVSTCYRCNDCDRLPGQRVCSHCYSEMEAHHMY